MSDRGRSIDAELIRYRIEKRMAGRRDLVLHSLVFVTIAVIGWMNIRWSGVQDLLIPGVLWTIPLILHGFRYYYRFGPGAIARADEIERAIEFDSGGALLDEDEERLIEDRAAKRIAARRLVVAHLATSATLVALLLILVRLNPGSWYDNVTRINSSTVLAIVFALHGIRFFLVHGRTPAGRALKIEGEVERLWHQIRERRQEADDDGVDIPVRDLGELRGQRVRLNAEGELEYGAGSEDKGGVRAAVR